MYKCLKVHLKYIIIVLVNLCLHCFFVLVNNGVSTIFWLSS